MKAVGASMMRLVTFENVSGSPNRRIGVQLKNEVVDLCNSSSGKHFPHDMRNFLRGGDALLDKANDVVESGAHRIPRQEVNLKAPIYDPEKILCIGLNYYDHAKESGMEVPSEPVLFSKYNSAIIGPGDSILLPEESHEVDYEVELVIVIGKEGRRIPESDAMQHVVGFTVGHDVSARDWQLGKPGAQWMAGKTFDTFAPLGPCIVTKNLLSDPHKLGIRTILNDVTVQNSNTEQIIFKTEQAVSYISNIMTLKPGDLIFTGTPPGVGFARSPPLYLKHGDQVTVEIDEIGDLTNPVKRL